MKNKGCLIGAVIAVLVLIFALSAFGFYRKGLNRAVFMDEAVKRAWAQVDVVLQRRYDLIPNLVNTVKGYAEHEEEVFTQVTKMRSQWGAAKTPGDKIAASGGFESAIGRLLLVAERYPDLKANENFRDLQVQLEGTENRIAQERRRYNDTVGVFNSYQREFFGRWFCSKRGLTEPASYFETTGEKVREAPEVSFD